MDLMNIWFQWQKKHDFSGPFFDFSPGFAALVSIEEEFASQDLQRLHQLPPGSLGSEPLEKMGNLIDQFRYRFR